MPRPYSGQFDDIAMAIGYALQAWSMVEDHVSHIFSNISGMSTIGAHTTFAILVSFEARLEVCHNVMKIELQDDKENLAVWAALKTRIAKGYKSRHQIAHFGVVSTHKDGSIFSTKLVPFYSVGLYFLEKPTDGIGVAEIDAKADVFRELAESVWWFNELVLKRRSMLPSVLRPDTNLIAKLRNLAVRKSAIPPAL